MEQSPHAERPETPLIEHWKRGPTLLASGSTFRAEQLEANGFREVIPFPDIPDHFETDTTTTLNEVGSLAPTYWDKAGAEFTRAVATAKVQYARAYTGHTGAVIAFDTAPVFMNAKNGQYHIPDKYASAEALQAGIVSQLTQLAAGMRALQATTDAERARLTAAAVPAAMQESVIATLRYSHPASIVSVQTAAALAVPELPNEVFAQADTARLHLQAVHAARDSEHALARLAEKIIETMGDRAYRITGGIDYADSYIRDLLNIHEIQPFETDRVTPESHYFGFNPYQIDTLLAEAALHVHNQPQQAAE